MCGARPQPVAAGAGRGHQGTGHVRLRSAEQKTCSWTASYPRAQKFPWGSGSPGGTEAPMGIRKRGAHVCLLPLPGPARLNGHLLGVYGPRHVRLGGLASAPALRGDTMAHPEAWFLVRQQPWELKDRGPEGAHSPAKALQVLERERYLLTRCGRRQGRLECSPDPGVWRGSWTEGPSPSRPARASGRLGVIEAAWLPVSPR